MKIVICSFNILLYSFQTEAALNSQPLANVLLTFGLVPLNIINFLNPKMAEASEKLWLSLYNIVKKGFDWKRIKHFWVFVPTGERITFGVSSNTELWGKVKHDKEVYEKNHDGGRIRGGNRERSR
jgi:hypothetical protein